MSVEERYINNISENKKNTLFHSFRIMTKQQIIHLARKYDLFIDSKQKYEEIQYKIMEFITKSHKGELLYSDIVDLAFNPDLDVMDGFFVSYDGTLNREKFIEDISEYNSEQENNNDDEPSNFELILNSDNFIKLKVKKSKKIYVHDVNTKISRAFQQNISCNIEIYSNSGIIYFQTSNSTSFSALRTIVQEFFKLHFQDDNLKLRKPKLYQNMDMIINLDGPSIAFSNINPVTLKLLDIIFELENKHYGFSGFYAKDIKFDHQESSQIALSTRIDAISLYGDNLLYHKEVKNKILDKRIILEMNFVIEYDETIDDKHVRKHFIEVGMNYSRNYFRIFINQNNDIDSNVISNAYKALKTMFINSYSNEELSNEGKILELLGVKKNE